MKNYNLTEALDLVKSDYVFIRKTDGIAICNSDIPGERITIGHVVEKLPMHINWLDEIDTDKAANVLDDDGDNVWILPFYLRALHHRRRIPVRLRNHRRIATSRKRTTATGSKIAPLLDKRDEAITFPTRFVPLL